MFEFAGLDGAPTHYEGKSLQAIKDIFIAHNLETNVMINSENNLNVVTFHKGTESEELFYFYPKYNTAINILDVFAFIPKEQEVEVIANIRDFLYELEGIHYEARKSPKTFKDTEGCALHIRLYKDSEWSCNEHPETLIGQPIGMYHCPQCMNMVVAGCLHPAKEG